MNIDNIKYTWLADSNNLYSDAVDETFKLRDGNIMIWECISWFGVNHMQRIISKTGIVKLSSISDSYLVPTLDQVAAKSGFTITGNISFQQDKNPKFTAAIRKD